MTRFVLALSLLTPLGACSGDDPCDPDAPGTICTIAGSTLNSGYKGDKGLATDAILYIPTDSVIAPDGNVWVMDFNNYVIRSIDQNGVIDTVFGTGQLGDSPVSDGRTECGALEASANHTPTMTFVGDYLYLAAWHQSRVNRLRMSDMVLENFAGRGVRTIFDGDGGPALIAGVDLPSSIAADPDGNIVFTDQANQVIRRVDSTGTINTIVGRCIIAQRICQNMGTQPVQCAGSNKWTCDAPTSCTGASPCDAAFAGDGGPAIDGRLGFMGGQAADPQGRIAYDKAGNLIIADTRNHRIRKVSPTGIITTIAGVGTVGFSGDDGPATAAELNTPVDIAIADDNTIYFSDVNNNCIRRIDTAGTISTVAGVCSANPLDRAFAGDGGPAKLAKMNRPYGIDLNGSKLYVSDSYNNRLRVVNLE